MGDEDPDYIRIIYSGVSEVLLKPLHAAALNSFEKMKKYLFYRQKAILNARIPEYSKKSWVTRLLSLALVRCLSNITIGSQCLTRSTMSYVCTGVNT